VAGDCGAHAQGVKEPGTIRREAPGAKVIVKEGRGVRQVVTPEQLVEGASAKVVQEAGGKIDVRDMCGGKRVAMQKTAGKIFRSSETSRFVDESGVQIHAGEFDSLRRKCGARGQPAYDIADAAADIDHAHGTLKTLRTQSRDYSAQQFGNAVAVEEFFGEALHFPMDGEQKTIDSYAIQETVVVWDCANGCNGLAILEAPECIENELFADSKTFERDRVVRDDEIRDLGLILS
jgi:hypothetical protein